MLFRPIVAMIIWRSKCALKTLFRVRSSSLRLSPCISQPPALPTPGRLRLNRSQMPAIPAIRCRKRTRTVSRASRTSAARKARTADSATVLSLSLGSTTARDTTTSRTWTATGTSTPSAKATRASSRPSTRCRRGALPPRPVARSFPATHRSGRSCASSISPKSSRSSSKRNS